MTVWRHIEKPEFGYANSLSTAMHIVDEHDSQLLWPVDDSRQMIFSDYSGQHREATHEVYSFLLTTWEEIQCWLPLWATFRADWLPDGRRMSFKQLREPMRRRAYPRFLDAVGRLKANLITVMIDNRVGSFVEGGPQALADVLDDCIAPGTSDASIEKIYRLSILIAMVQSGLRRERQPSLWISDHDETLDSWDRRERFSRLTTYLAQGLTGWRNAAYQDFMTTEAKNLPAWIEDLVAIPDAAAGACAQLSRVLPTFVGETVWKVSIPSEGDRDWQASIFADWLSAPHGILRHVLLRLAPDDHGAIRASAQKFQRRPS